MTTTYTHLRRVEDEYDDDGAAPLLPHEIAASKPPTQTPLLPPKRLQLGITNQRASSPASSPRPPSPLEPFPAFDPSVGPPEPSPTPPITYLLPAPTHRHHQLEEHAERDPRPNPRPQHDPKPAINAARHNDVPAFLSREDFLPSMIRCHTLFSLAERLPPTKARAYLCEARSILLALEVSNTPGPQMIELSAGTLRKRLRALEEGVALREKREEEEREGETREKELNEGTARVSGWLDELKACD